MFLFRLILPGIRMLTNVHNLHLWEIFHLLKSHDSDTQPNGEINFLLGFEHACQHPVQEQKV